MDTDFGIVSFFKQRFFCKVLLIADALKAECGIIPTTFFISYS